MVHLRNVAGFLFVCLSLLAPGSGCSSSQHQTLSIQYDPVPTRTQTHREQMLRTLFQDRHLQIIFGADTDAQAEQLRTRFERVRGFRRMQTTMHRATNVHLDSLGQAPMLLVGTPETNPHIKNLVRSPHLRFLPEGFQFLDRRYTNPDYAVSMLMPHPDNGDIPLFIVTGNSTEAVLEWTQQDIMMYDYQVGRGNQRIRMGHFSQNTGEEWAFSPASDHDLENDRQTYQETAHLHFQTYKTPAGTARMEQLVANATATVARVLAFAGQESLDRPLSYVVYPSVEAKAVLTDNMQQAHVDYEQNTIHVATERLLRGEDQDLEAALMLWNLYDRTPDLFFNEGLAIYFSDSWHGQGYEHWGKRLLQAGIFPSLSEFSNNEQYEQVPSMLRKPVAGLLVQELLHQHGEAAIRDHLKGNKLLPLSESLATAWESIQEKAAALPLAASRAVDLPFQKGFNFAHEGYRIVNGYGSKVSDESIGMLSQLGTSALSIIPYSFMRSPTTPTPLYIDHGPGGENDESVVHAATTAKDKGLVTMMKPQIWIRGSWPGDINMATQAEWDTFFHHYERWITHYALLSEMYGFDVLCIGTELTQAALQHEMRWREIIKKIRVLYSGRLTYASNWGEEFENVAFWDALDYIGLDNYYPLSDKPDASKKDLQKGARDIISKIEVVHERFNKPVLLTEVGFPSIEHPWIQPHASNNDAPANGDHQALGYEVLLEAFYDQSWFAGMYWWKWPSTPDRGGDDHKGFTPNGKPATSVISYWFNKYPD